MQYKLITTAAIVATALAAPSPANTESDSDVYNLDTSDYNSLLLDYLNPPTSIRSVLATAIPSSFYMDMMDPASSSSILSDINAGNFPAWYSSLPNNVKAWATTAFEDDVATASPTLSSEILATASDSAAASTSSVVVTSGTGSAAATSSTATTGSTSAEATSSQSTAGAPRSTGGVAVGVAGAVGVLALAIGL
ncbi:hypothetical protein N7478_002982 [Penicillium angulare]|uniref:uncharacterized protein n=1 Tax=Penicillium angulare TaxID=116970 RepID=UPI002541D522|nr:uncharacterized protein N7478_002982 [Penicillium angulare]KAJ5287296.1 hypothetical protein N7478_002982 [Penicillium angulare]